MNYWKWSLWGHDLAFGRLQVMALIIVAVVTLINCAAVSVSGKIATFLTALKVVLVLGVGFGAFFLAKGSFDYLEMPGMRHLRRRISDSSRWIVWFRRGETWRPLGLRWLGESHNGCRAKAKNPQRNLPLALIGGMICIAILYTLVRYIFWAYSSTDADRKCLSNLPSQRKWQNSFSVRLAVEVSWPSACSSLHWDPYITAFLPELEFRMRWRVMVFFPPGL